MRASGARDSVEGASLSMYWYFTVLICWFDSTDNLESYAGSLILFLPQHAEANIENQ